MARKLIITIILAACVYLLAGAQAGRGVYAFLDLPTSSRMAALGGSNVSVFDHDVNFVFQNPALLSEQTDKVIGLNYVNYLADINYGSAVYGMNFGKNYLSFGVQYMDYGKFLEKTENNTNPGGGDEETVFSAQDLAIYASYARPIGKGFTVGATFKPIFSHFETYTSFGFAFDMGASYLSPSKLFSAGLVFRNMGTQLKGYYSDEEGQHYEPLDFDIQLGVSQKLQHAPLRFTLTLHNLNRWNLRYQSTNKPTQSVLSGDDSSTRRDRSNPGFFDMAFRHAIIGVEFLPTDNVYVTLSYNHRRHQELSIEGVRSLAGFAFGAGIKVYKFHVGFAMTQFQTGLNAYLFTLSTSLNEFGRL